KTVVLTDCALIGGDSGGPLFDLDGKLIGIHSSIGETIDQNR
ncbi:MAG TPA: serine protease, partial [Planctomycetaceae bacterium]|nr:serine protease [Planctomycetaceae bacterium]